MTTYHSHAGTQQPSSRRSTKQTAT